MISFLVFLVNNLRDYVGKTENHRGTTSLFTRTFSRLAEKTTSKQRDCSEMIQGLTYINEVCDKRYLSQIDSVCEKHSASTFWKIIRSCGLSKKYKPTYDDCSYVPNDENFIISILGEVKEYGCSTFLNFCG